LIKQVLDYNDAQYAVDTSKKEKRREEKRREEKRREEKRREEKREEV